MDRRSAPMSQGSAPRQTDLFHDTRSFVEPLDRPDSIHALLAPGAAVSQAAKRE